MVSVVQKEERSVVLVSISPDQVASSANDYTKLNNLSKTRLNPIGHDSLLKGVPETSADAQ